MMTKYTFSGREVSDKELVQIIVGLRETGEFTRLDAQSIMSAMVRRRGESLTKNEVNLLIDEACRWYDEGQDCAGSWAYDAELDLISDIGVAISMATPAHQRN